MKWLLVVIKIKFFSVIYIKSSSYSFSSPPPSLDAFLAIIKKYFHAASCLHFILTSLKVDILGGSDSILKRNANIRIIWA